MNSKLNLVCVIDDDPIYTFAIKRLLKRNNICNEYVVYKNGQDAIEGLTNNPENVPDLILLDINMPIMDGWKFLDAYKEIRLVKTTTIYITSSSINNVDLNKANANCLVSGYISKPMSTEKLLKIKNTFL